MKEMLYVIATRGRYNKELYLAIDEDRYGDKVYFKWVEDVDKAYATFTYNDIVDTAKCHFKNYNKWYITSYEGVFK